MIPILHTLEDRAMDLGIDIDEAWKEATNAEKIASRLAMGKGHEIDDMKKWNENYCKIIVSEHLTQFVLDAVNAQEAKLKSIANAKLIEASRQELF